MKARSLFLAFAALGGSLGLCIPAAAQDRAADIAGEIGTATALLQARITPAQRLAAAIPDGIEGWARFEAADNPQFVRPVVSDWLMIKPENDYVVKFMLGKVHERHNEMEGGTQYFWRVRYGLNPSKLIDGPVHTFKTLSGSLASRAVRLAVVQGIDPSAPAAAAKIAQVAATKPDYVVFLGNSVAYDRAPAATTLEAMRAKWHDLFGDARIIELLNNTGTYWLKNDRDFRFNDADTTGDEAPSAELGATVFREQVPVVDLHDPASLTFRVEQATRDLALWMLEVRDYRSANQAADNKDKSLWGTSQAEWLQRSLVSSSTPFKIVVQPTPLLGPAPAGSRDSHANVGGFRTERQAFLDHAKANHLGEKGLLILTGSDWQYHSVAADGLEEISVGSLTSPADTVPAPDASLKQAFCPAKAAAGFALIDVAPAADGKPAKLTLSLVQADNGEVVYTTSRTAGKP